MKVLLTGATGFLGTALSAALQRHRDIELVALSSKDCDLTDATAVRSLTHGRFDRIFHLAAWTRAGDFCLHHPGEQWIINQQINTNVLEWWKACQSQAKLIAIGTSCSYDEHLPHSEENYLCGQPTPSLFTYAMTKRMLLVGLEALHKQFGLSYLHIVPSTLYGPGYHEDGRQMHFIFDIIRKVLLGNTFGEPVVLWGDGYQRRELIYIDDFVQNMLKLADLQTNETINIGAGADHTIREFAHEICRIVGYDTNEIQFDSGQYVGARSKCLRIDKLKRILPERSSTPLSEGLERTVAWMQPRIESLRRQNLST